jgi:uncharacterized protein (TIRG00374 family)
METPKPKITRKTVLFPLIGLAAFFLYIYLFQVDISAIIAKVQQANPIIYIIAMAFSLVEVFFFSISWRVLVNFLKVKLSISRSYLFVWYSIFVDTIIPAESISGEALRVYLIAKEQGDQTCGKTIASLLTHRLLGMGMNIVVLIIGLGLLFTETKIDPIIFNLIIFLAIGITATLLLTIIFAFKEKWSLKVINWLVRFGKWVTRGKWHLQLNKIKEYTRRMTISFHDSMKEYKRSPKALISSSLYLAIAWVFSLTIPYLVFMSLGSDVSWSIILITSAIVLAVKSVPIGVPFEVGLPEITMTSLYVGLGVPGDISATATILSRIVTLWFRFFTGFIAQQWLELKPVLVPTNNY